MRSVEYYCGDSFEPSLGRVLTAEQWLYHKILSATELHHQLAHQSYLDRDDLRIKRIDSAIKDWYELIDEINGKSQDIQ